jgi:threonine aldolase
MDRRSFLATSGLAAAAPLLSSAQAAPVAKPPGVSSPLSPAMFSRVSFVTDGLDLDTREYAALLQEAAQAGGIEADWYSNGGVVAALEEKFAALLGKQAAMFVPTGTLANHMAVRKLAGDDRRVLVQAESHLYNDSGDCAGLLSGLNLVPLAVGKTTIGLDEVRHWVERSASGRVEMKVGVLSIESPVRRRDHAAVDFAELQRVCAYAREQGIRLHLDGARLFNLPRHTGHGLREYAALFDTVYVSLWKHFNGMSGAILAGDTGFIEGLYHMRRMFGGSLPRAWPGVALVGGYVDRYEQDYAQAWQAAERLFAALRQHAGFTVRHLPDGTSRVFLSVTGVDPDDFVQRLRAHGVILGGARRDTGEIAMDVNPTLLRRSSDVLAGLFVEALAPSA